MDTKTILIIDDEPVIVELLSEMLTENKWITYCADNGLDALKIVTEKNPKVILSDIKIPGMDGLEFQKKIFDMGLNTPVIFLTGYRDAKKMQLAWESCVYDFLDKPIDENLVLHTVENALLYGEDYVTSSRKRFQRIRKTPA